MDSATKVRRRLQTAKHFLGRFSLCSLRVGFYQTKHQGADSILLKAFISVFFKTDMESLGRSDFSGIQRPE